MLLHRVRQTGYIKFIWCLSHCKNIFVFHCYSNTGVGESPPRQDLPKEISSAMAGVDCFDSDPLFPEPIKLDPLDIDTLHMLTDNDLVADQATEDSFRLDRL